MAGIRDIFWVFFFLNLALLVITWWIARGKKHETVIRILSLLSLGCSPLSIAALIWACCDKSAGVSDGDRYPCPACRELIVRGASKCRFCGEVLPPQPMATAEPLPPPKRKAPRGPGFKGRKLADGLQPMTPEEASEYLAARKDESAKQKGIGGKNL